MSRIRFRQLSPHTMFYKALIPKRPSPRNVGSVTATGSSSVASRNAPALVFASSLAVALSLAFAPSASSAADKPAAAPAKSASAVLTRAELRDCFAQQDAVRADKEGIEKERAALEAEKAAIAKRSAELNDKLAALDQTNADAVNAHNAEVAAREKTVDEFQVRVAAYNSHAEAVRGRQQSYIQSCGNRVYEEKDEAAIRKRK